MHATSTLHNSRWRRLAAYILCLIMSVLLLLPLLLVDGRLAAAVWALGWQGAKEGLRGEGGGTRKQEWPGIIGL